VGTEVDQGILSDPGKSMGQRRQSEQSLERRLTEHLLRHGVRPAHRLRPKIIAADLGVPYSSVTAQLRRLTETGRAHMTYAVNPYRTRFCHEYRIGLQVEVHKVQTAYEQLLTSADEDERRAAALHGGPVEWFLNGLVDGVKKHESLAEHLIVTDVVMLHGAPGRDVEVTVLTDDGIYSVGRYVRDVLGPKPFIVQSTTQTVAWRYRFEGYCGKHATGSSTGRAESPAV
jgi:hypothetical protein